MVLTSEEVEDDARTLRARVLNELEVIRRGDGVGLVQIATHGESVMQLRAVVKSAATKGLALDLAALEYLRCIAQSRRILGNEYQRLIWVTMNFDGSPTNLNQRRTQLTGRLMPSAADRSRERRAFESFAAQLVSRTVSPCDEPGGAEDDKAWVNALLSASFEEDAADLIRLAMDKLRRLRTDDEARDIARRIIELVPTGLTTLGVTDASSPDLVVVAAQRLLRGAHALAAHRGATESIEMSGALLSEMMRARGAGSDSPYREQINEIVGRTAMWLEDTSSWSEMLQFGREGFVRITEPAK